MAGARKSKEALLHTDLSSTITLRTSLASRALLCTRARTLLTTRPPRKSYFLLTSKSRLFERYIEIIAQIVSSSATAASAWIAAHRATEKRAENISKDIFKSREVPTLKSAGTSALIKCCMPKAVVPRSTIGITQDRIRLSGFFKLLFGFFVAWILIGMKLNGLLTIGFFNVVE
jgi:hypothetical protein